ncbi:MAG: hypothetical protein SFY95_12275 [Planctomycetota bacterium]|nr:hypothetical protein [Planctomycetota bacterium]
MSDERDPTSQAEATPDASDAAPSEERAGFSWRTFFGHLSVVTAVALLAAIPVGVSMLKDPVREKAATIATARPVPIRIEWPGVPAGGKAEDSWLPQYFREHLQARAESAARDHADPFSPEALRAIAEAMQDSGWFGGLPRVARVSLAPDPRVLLREGEASHELVVSGTWRVPAAVVRADGREFLCGWDGKPMPAVYLEGRSGKPFIIGVSVTGASPDLKPEDPEAWRVTWDESSVRSALELLALVARQPWAEQIAGIDVTAFAREKSLALLTKADTKIVWGGTPDRPNIGENSTLGKLDKLAAIQRQFQRIDAGLPLIDITTPHVLTIDTSPVPGSDVGGTGQAAIVPASGSNP